MSEWVQTMNVNHEERAASLRRHLTDVSERCRRQRATLMFEREQVQLCREMRDARARLQLRRAFRDEVEAATRPLVESVG
jgi:hypothetical protein